MPWSPQRSLKPEPLYHDERFSTLPREQRQFLMSLLLYVDAMGREVATSRVLLQAFYEFDEDMTTDQIDDMLTALEKAGWLLLYISSRRILLQINPAAFAEFIKIDQRDGSRFTAPEPSPEAAQRAAWATVGQTSAEGKGDGVGFGESPPWMSDSEMPPPQGCPKHPNNTGLIACGPCAGARKIHTRFMAGELTHAEAVEAYGGQQ